MSDSTRTRNSAHEIEEKVLRGLMPSGHLHLIVIESILIKIQMRIDQIPREVTVEDLKHATMELGVDLECEGFYGPKRE